MSSEFTVSGNTNFLGLYGGYYQGFFKLEDYPYQVHPIRTSKGWTYEFVLRHRTSADTISVVGNSIASAYTSDNYGFFFYLGTRAENKFSNYYSGETGYTTTLNNPISYLSAGTDILTYSAITASTGTLQLLNESVFNYDRISAVTDNAMGFRITVDGKIGYRSLSGYTPCDIDFSLPAISEAYTDENIIPLTNNDWHNLSFVFVRDSPSFIPDEILFTGCTNNVFTSTGQLRLYYDGMLLKVFENFEEPSLRGFDNEFPEKQIGVPYSLSWGGGSVGLSRSQTFNGNDAEDKNLFIERYFNGSFLGDIAQVRYYDIPLNVAVIRQNIEVEKELYNINVIKGGRIITPPPPFVGD